MAGPGLFGVILLMFGASQLFDAQMNCGRNTNPTTSEMACQLAVTMGLDYDVPDGGCLSDAPVASLVLLGLPAVGLGVVVLGWPHRRRAAAAVRRLQEQLGG